MSTATATPSLGLLPDPSEIPQMMIDLGVRPIRCGFSRFNESGRLVEACALATVVATKVPHGIDIIRDNGVMGGVLERVGLSSSLAWHVVDGFDSMVRTLNTRRTSEQIAAYEWGQAAWQACVDAGLAEELQEVDTETA